MKNVITFFCLALSIQSFGQQLSFSQIGTEPAHCRLFNYQSGNGVIFAAASGGTPPYSYQWTNLQTTATTSNTVWGGLNPGDYEVKVWDAVGDSIYQVVTLDSLNPISAIEVVTGPVSGSDPHFYGTAPVTVDFINQSQNYTNINDPNSDTTFFWRMTQFENWFILHDIQPDQQYTYNFGGDWAIDLVCLNKNGCADTSTVYLHLSGPSEIEEVDNNTFSIISNPDQDQLIVSSAQTDTECLFKVYDLSGKLVFSQRLFDSINTIRFSKKGIFVYEIVDLAPNIVVTTGKFNF